MRTDLDYLPAIKQRELEHVVRVLFGEFATATAIATSDWKRHARILKVILYGSYARGNWVDELHTAKGYRSDYDLLVIVNHDKLTDRVAFWSGAEDRFNRELVTGGALKTPVNFIVHSLAEVTDGLAQGRYFFADIARDGIALYQADDTDLPKPKPLTPADALALAREYMDEWWPSANEFYDNYRFNMGQGRLNNAAFQLHQTAERFYHCVLLVCTFYSPHVHNLAFLRTQAERIDARLAQVWPAESRRDRGAFAKLKEAYVKARYSKRFLIDEGELAWLGDRVEELGRVVAQVCGERIEQLAGAVSPKQSQVARPHG